MKKKRNVMRKQEQPMSTIKDVARRTGLSLSTISKYLNGGNILKKLITKIWKENKL